MDDSLIRDYLVHEIYPRGEVELAAELLHREGEPVVAVVLIVLGNFLPIETLEEECGEIGDLGFGGEHFAEAARALNGDLVYLSVVYLTKTGLHETLEIELEIHPHSLDYLATRNPRMQGLLCNVVFPVRVALRSLKHQSFLVSQRVTYPNFH